MKKKIKNFWNWVTNFKEFGNKPIEKYIVWLLILSGVLTLMFRIICVNPLIDSINNANSSIENISSSLDVVKSSINIVSSAIDAK